MKNYLRNSQIRLSCLSWRLLAKTGALKSKGAPVQFIVENADWAIRWVGEHIRDEIKLISPGKVDISSDPSRISRRVVHFGSQYMWLKWGNHMSRSNQFITSFFHGKPEDGPDVERHIDEFLKSVPSLTKVVTGAGIIENRLLRWGVPREKLIRIPIGVDTNLFKPSEEKARSNIRRDYNIPESTILIGSFQKDGMGWGDGMEPKMIKGPDLFISSLKLLSSKGFPVMAFLTGPARGYVKEGLKANGIPYIHKYAPKHVDLVPLYHALDLYFVTSREEGGPMGLMESMASGIPVVSTQVGMSVDLIDDLITGGIAKESLANDIANKAEEILKMSSNERNELIEKARKKVLLFDWSIVAKRHWTEVYKPLIN